MGAMIIGYEVGMAGLTTAGGFSLLGTGLVGLLALSLGVILAAAVRASHTEKAETLVFECREAA